MPTNLPNIAQITYSYNGNSDTVLSNQTNTTLIDEYTVSLTKTPVSDEVRAGDNAAYVLTMRNTGSGALYNPTITDDLGAAGAASPLTYAEGSALFYINGAPSTGTAATGENGVVFTSAAILQPNDILTVVYRAATRETQAAAITNTATATANSGSATGAAINAAATATITPQAFANVSVFKSADKSSVISGDTLTYTFTLLNTGGEAAENIRLVDALPSEFTVNSVSYEVNGTTTQIPASDYAITAPNTLTVPTQTSTLTIGVPAATETGPGVTTITVTGTVTQ